MNGLQLSSLSPLSPSWVGLFHSRPPPSADELINIYLKGKTERFSTELETNIHGDTLTRIQAELKNRPLNVAQKLTLGFAEPSTFCFDKVKELIKFGHELAGRPRDASLRALALKVSNIIYKNNCYFPTETLYAFLQTSDRQLWFFHRYQWAAHAPAYTPFLLGNWSSPKKLSLSKSQILAVENFMNQNLDLRSLSVNELFELRETAGYLQYDELEKGVETTLQAHFINLVQQGRLESELVHITKENYQAFLDAISEYKMPSENVFQWGTVVKESLFYIANHLSEKTLKASLEFSRVLFIFYDIQPYMRRLAITKLDDFSLKFLKMTQKGWICIEVDLNLVPELIEEGIEFSTVREVHLTNNAEENSEKIQMAAKLFPNAKRCVVSPQAFIHLKTVDFQKWENLKILETQGKCCFLEAIKGCQLIQGFEGGLAILRIQSTTFSLVKSIDKRFVAYSQKTPLTLDEREHGLFKELNLSSYGGDAVDLILLYFIVFQTGNHSDNGCFFSSLTRIDVGSHCLQPQTIQKMIQCCVKLESLNLKGCQIDEVVLLQLAEKLSALKWLNIESCNVSAQTYSRIKALLPKCEIISGYNTERKRLRLAP